MRKTPLITGQFYHVYNRGTDKRKIFLDQKDADRFFQSMREFNTIDTIGSLYENSFIKKDALEGKASKKLVNFICYCLNPNHFHFILQQVADRGIEKFMQRLGTGYTKYFNGKYERNGVLFQGVFKSIHVDSNEYLLHLSAYVNLNNRVHQLGSETSKLVKSSWEEYTEINNRSSFCKKGIILKQFTTAKEYKEFASEALLQIVERRHEFEDLLIE